MKTGIRVSEVSWFRVSGSKNIRKRTALKMSVHSQIRAVKTQLKGAVSSRSEHIYFQQRMESVSYINTVTENYWLIHAAATVK